MRMQMTGIPIPVLPQCKNLPCTIHLFLMIGQLPSQKPIPFALTPLCTFTSLHTYRIAQEARNDLTVDDGILDDAGDLVWRDAAVRDVCARGEEDLRG